LKNIYRGIIEKRKRFYSNIRKNIHNRISNSKYSLIEVNLIEEIFLLLLELRREIEYRELETPKNLRDSFHISSTMLADKKVGSVDDCDASMNAGIFYVNTTAT